jgi:hypothetical protein
MLMDGTGKGTSSSDVDFNGKQCANDDQLDKKVGEKNATVLPKSRICYCCKVRYRIMHHFYDQLCPECAPYNFMKRHQTADMTNLVAIVTGSRVKIGFQVCLKLLRAGATVVATTRFPNNAVAAYRNEKDFSVWKNRLHVYGLDLRDVAGLEAFTRYLKMKYGHCGIDVLINNACQTIRRPAGYYMPLVRREREIWMKGDDAHRDVLKGCIEFEHIRRRLVIEHSSLVVDGNIDRMDFRCLLGTESPTHGDTTVESCNNIVAKQNDIPFEFTGISHSTALSQIALVSEDVGINEKDFPQ